MNTLKWISVLSFLVVAGCATTGDYLSVRKAGRKKPKGCPLKVIMPGQKIKKDSELIGTFSVQEAGLSVNCGWEKTLRKNRDKACAVGADAIQFIEVNTPSFSSTCYTTKANFLELVD